MGGEGERDGCEGEGDFFMGEEVAEFLEGAFDAFLGGGFGEVEFMGDGWEGLVLEIAEEEGGAIHSGESGEGIIEVRGDFGKLFGGLYGRRGGIHGGGLSFVGEAAAGAFAEVVADETGDGVKPGGEVGGMRKGGGFFGEDDEDGLGGIFGGVGIGELAAGGGVDEREVAVDELAEGVLGFG